MGIQSLPQLTMNEWQMVLNVYDGSSIEPHQPLTIATDIMDDRGAISLADLTPEYLELVQKIHKGASKNSSYKIRQVRKK